MLQALDVRLLRLPSQDDIDREIAKRIEEKYTKQSEAQFKKERKKQSRPSGGLLAFIRYFWSVLEPVTPLVEGWALEAMCTHLEAVTAGKITRLLMNVPPGFMKSLLVNVMWPAWEWGPQNMPHLRTVAFSYSPDLTERDNNKFLALVSSARYRSLWGERFTLRKQGSSLITNDRTGSRRASSIGGVGTGERGDRVVLDDPHNVVNMESEKEREATARWFRESMSNRLNDQRRSAIVIIMQRLHEDDVSGVILANEFDYCHLMIPMEFAPDRYPVKGDVVEWDGNEIGWIDPRALDDDGIMLAPYDLDQREGMLAWEARFPAEVVAKFKHEMGPYAFSGQYQQAPSPRKGAIFDRDWWQLYEPPTESGKFPPMEFVLASLDSAFTEKEENDPSGFVMLGVFRPMVVNQGTGESEPGAPQVMLMTAWRKHLRIHGVDVPRKPNETNNQYIRRAMPQWGLCEWVAHSCRRFGGADMLLIEAKASGIDVINEMKRLYGDEQWGIEGRQAPKDKVIRALAVQPTFSQQLVWAPATDWADMVQKEMAMFPKGKYKDLTDAMTHAVKWLREKGLIQRPEEISRLERARSEFRKSRPKVLYEA